MRANHPKGVVLEGTFTPSASAASVSKAAHLKKQKKPIPVTVRFSAGSGLPTVPDTNEMPRGMSVKFSLPDGSKTDLVVLSYNGFPVATAEEFRDFLLAIAASGPDAPKPSELEKFLSAHPAAKTFVETPKPPPASYATLPYFGINAFKFTNAKGVATHVRYQLQPVAGAQYLSKEQVSTKGPDYLTTEIRTVCVVVPSSSNCSRRWPNEMTRSTIPRSCGRIPERTLSWAPSPSPKRSADSEAAQKKLLFMPGALDSRYRGSRSDDCRAVGGLYRLLVSSCPGTVSRILLSARCVRRRSCSGRQHQTSRLCGG